MDIVNINGKNFYSFPYSLVPDFLDPELPDYQISKFNSASNIEWRSQITCAVTNAKLSLKWENKPLNCVEGCFSTQPLDDNYFCKLVDCWKTTSGGLYSFKIPDDHPMWELIPFIDVCFKESIKPFDNWVFENKPTITVNYCGIYVIEVDLIQKVDCACLILQSQSV